MTREEFGVEWHRHLSRLKIVARGYSPTSEEEVELYEMLWEIKGHVPLEELNRYLLSVEYGMLTPQGVHLN